MNKTSEIIKEYYEAFNAGNMPKFLDMLSDNVIHDINQGGIEKGKQTFAKFMEKMNLSYKENITDLVIMANDDGKHAAAEFFVEGTYLKTDSGLPEAKGQKYKLKAGSFFEIENGKISRITVYYNLNEWLKQVSNA